LQCKSKRKVMARESNNETQTGLGDETTPLKNGNASGDTSQPFSEGELSMQGLAEEADDPAPGVGNETVENGEIPSLVPNSTSETTEVSPGKDLAPLGAEMALDADLADDTGSAELPDTKAINIPFHPLASIFPLPPEHELRAMADDIAAHGLLEPIVMFEDMILDGRCRYLSCKTAKVRPRFVICPGNDPVAYVLSRNVRRRHLTDAQRALVAARVANLEIGANQHSAGLPIGRASRLLTVSERSIARAKEVLRGGVPELVQAVESGAVSLLAGAQISRTPPEQQRHDLELGGASSVASTDSGSMPPPPIRSPEESNDRRADQDASPTGQICPGWVWNDIIPLSGVTAIIGGAATTLVTAKIAATVCRAWDWPDHSTASGEEILWLAASKSLAEHIRSQIAPRELNHSVHMVTPDLDTFGLPIRHFAVDLDRLRGQIEQNPGVGLVTIDSFVDYVRGDDVENSVAELHQAIKALSEFATEHRVAVIVPCELMLRNPTMMRAVNAFNEVSEVATVLVAASGPAPNSGNLLVRKRPAAAGELAFAFRIQLRNSMRTLIWNALANEMGDDLSF
jgi:AAA domain